MHRSRIPLYERPAPDEPAERERASPLLDVRGHTCAFFRSADEEYRVLLPFIKDGLERGERAFHTVDPARRAEHVDRIAGAGIDVEAAQRRGQFELRVWAEAHLTGGSFDAARMTALVAEAQQRARAHGFARTRYVTHMEWALPALPFAEALAEYEADATARRPDDGDAVVCVFHLPRWGGQVLVDAMRAHPRVILGGALHENPFFVPPHEFLHELRARRAGVPT